VQAQPAAANFLPRLFGGGAGAAGPSAQELAAAAARSRLLAAVEGTERGLNTSSEQKEEVWQQSRECVCVSAALHRPSLLLRPVLAGRRARPSLHRPPTCHTRQVLAAAAELAELGGGGATTDADSLSATWQLVWTTEKETLFILQNAGLFGTAAGDVLQV
jgi:hypothetical protein